MTKEIRVGNLLIRLDKHGDLDEIVVSDSASRCSFHMERMGKDRFWMRFYNTKKNPQDNKDVVVWLSSRGKALKADFDIEDFTDESIDIPEPAECTKVADSAGV